MSNHEVLPDGRFREAMMKASQCSHPGSLLLLVDPDDFLQEMIESGFQLFNPDWTILKASHPGRALLLFQRYEVEAVITEIEFPGEQKGTEFLRYLEKNAPELPVFILTEAPAETVQSLTTADFIAKPPDMDYLIGKVHRAVQRRRESVLRGISLENFLQMLEVERKTCTLTVISSRHAVGRFFVRKGKLIHAETEGLRGRAAAFDILSWSDYSIKITDRCEAEETIHESLTGLLMEWCVDQDHHGHAG